MNFISLLATLMLEHAYPAAPSSSLPQALRRYADWLAHSLNAGEHVHGVLAWCVAVLPWLALGLGMHYLLWALSPVLAWVWSVVVLYFCIGLRQLIRSLAAVFEVLSGGDLEGARSLLAQWRQQPVAGSSTDELRKLALETAIIRAHRELFAPLLWSIVLPGPSGAILYRLAAMLSERWDVRSNENLGEFGRFAADLFRILDWLPLRVTALGFGIAGDFEDAAYCWRTQARTWLDPEQGVILASAAGALELRLGGTLHGAGDVQPRPDLGLGEEPDEHAAQGVIALIWRTLTIGMGLLFLVTVVHWVAG